ncbi:MAG TPA: sulfurtransferase TusC, partial [Pseudomonas sp.]|nr:sulfurtransferase TusC [Pseudomonas sp.]
ESLYAAKRSLSERGLDDAQLSLPVELLDDAGLGALINRYDHVITL